MRLSSTSASLLALATAAFAQNVTVPNYCTSGFQAGTDTVLFTVPYTYAQVMSIIGSYQNLTWSGNPVNTVTLNGSDNTVGTARTYDTAGAHVIETLLTYSKPAAGPYVEVHNTALVNIAAANLSFYIPFDGTVVTSVCGGAASMFNFTANYCGSSNATLAGPILHMLHSADAMTVGTFLGGKNFTTCAALGASNSTVVLATATATATGTASPAKFTGGAAQVAKPGALLAGLGLLALAL